MKKWERYYEEYYCRLLIEHYFPFYCFKKSETPDWIDIQNNVGLESNLDADQIYFVNQIIEYIVRNGVMKDMSVLREAPFTDRGSIVEVFTDISIWLGIRSVIEKINANAAA